MTTDQIVNKIMGAKSVLKKCLPIYYYNCNLDSIIRAIIEEYKTQIDECIKNEGNEFFKRVRKDLYQVGSFHWVHFAFNAHVFIIMSHNIVIHSCLDDFHNVMIYSPESHCFPQSSRITLFES